MALTDDAKNAIHEAFEIVKHDKLISRIRKATAPAAPATPAAPTPGSGPTPPAPPTGGPTPPPAVPPTDPPPPPQTGAKSAYWGELLNGD